jgi:hypothetical protein
MPHNVMPVDDTPILMVTMTNPYDYYREPQQLFAEIHALTDQMAGRIFVIYDCRSFELTFDDVINKMAIQTKGLAGSISDERLETIIVGSGELFHLMVESFRQEQYGGQHVHLFESMDDVQVFLEDSFAYA